MGLFNWLFARACRVVFDQVDRDKNGRLDALEIEIAILHLYNVFNKKMPGWQDPPARDEIQASLKAFDKDGNGTLEPAEFVEFARSMMKSGPDMFFARVGKQTAINTAVLPAAGMVIQRATQNSLPAVAGVPLAVLAPVIGNIFGAVRGLLPV
mmetsp:Transcript_6750/g.16808  ORF Transcript_6750/g.16808 Transcript_6750/m.16808 type:complete len:153 (-) Transcript_6750:258-716(-)|eukprot:CAMPEP_0202864662 /NCGR_PEP_ID=MMETSP1391-20130828/4814_1 /ASSEMBLY_ACC=CAM_ASM_000867 /TAXON_ID=1034604 /ORGANISM="Chlamydomonas leiostraca, Strain SAG 11-49" /LENGTH=152 /DNA_ID=CAMNT_0049544429 /DNA_START=62 /DNA_END=520 /DNA_ORIENTATION=+